MSIYEDSVTQLLLENIDKWYTGYKNVNIEYRTQAVCRYKNGGHGRVDLRVWIYRGFAKKEGNIYNFEIKSCVGDLNSGKGLNLYGMYNYLVYPRMLITTLPGIITHDMAAKKLHEIGCDHVGIIGIISDNDFIVERKAKRYLGDGMPCDIKSHKYR